MRSDEFRERCKGIVPVQYCPYKDDFELDIEGLRENTEFLVDFAEEGKRDLMIMTNGSTTEFYANSIEEQKAVIETVVKTVDGRVPVIAGTSQAGTLETVKMTKYAEEAGADCAMVVLPYYHAPTREGLYRHYETIAKSVKIGIMVYSNADVSGTLLDANLLQRLSKIDNVVAVKDNNPNVAEYAWKSALLDPKDISLLNGFGEMHYIASAAYGFKYRGFVTWIGNFAPDASYEIYEAVKSKDFDRAMNSLKRILPLNGLLEKFMKSRESLSIIPQINRTNYMYMSVGKACLDMVGLHGGPLKQPLEDLTEKERKELRQVLVEADLTED
jgi:4-hydroxy-tetrahydrodipicolinate synthase